MESIIIIGCAFGLDLILGDPFGSYHPICLIGNGIRRIEKIVRKIGRKEIMAGGIMVVVVTSLSFLFPFLLLQLCKLIHPSLKLIVETIFCYQILAIKSLKVESTKVYAPLQEGKIDEARKYLSYIVGRDTKELHKEGIIKATIETIAENTTDGVIAPLMFMLIGGAPLGFWYKSINTMDSMVGYKNHTYLYFGKIAAKLDDLVNYIPARIGAIFMIISSFLLKMNVRESIRIYQRDRKKHASPNSAQTESVCAGALEIELAGRASYFGEIVEKPTIGDNKRKVEPKDILRANKLMYMTSCIGFFIMVIIKATILYVMK